jgi:hypothetical protein
MDSVLKQRLIEFRDKLKSEGESNYSFAAINDNVDVQRVEEQFANMLFKYSRELNEIIVTDDSSSKTCDSCQCGY